jgi:hypothetical protein
MMKKLAGVALLALASGSALAAERPVVVELFTSLACSDCPPADSLLGTVRDRVPGALVLDLHVTYWNNSSWTDPYSLPEVDERQKQYAAVRGDQQVYTPEAVVNGRQSFIGSDAKAMADALVKATAGAAAEGSVPITLGNGARGIAIQVGIGSGEGVVWLFGFDPERTTAVNGGENTGATVREVNVVRGIIRVGVWRGRRLRLITRAPPGKRFAAILQRPDGKILGAAST